MIGKTVSHYRITEKLSQGGMGEVCRTEDTNLSRHVAIKVPPDEFASDSERLAPFERKAKVLSSLSHPNIAAIQGLEQADGKRFVVLEQVDPLLGNWVEVVAASEFKRVAYITCTPFPPYNYIGMSLRSADMQLVGESIGP